MDNPHGSEGVDPPGIGLEGKQAIEIIRKVFIEERQINTCDCRAFYSPQEWRKLRHRVPAEIELGLRPVLVIPYSGGLVGGCFDGFESDKFDDYLKLPENQRVRVNPTVLAMRRKLTDEFQKVDLVAREWCPSYSFVCKKPGVSDRRDPERPRGKRKPVQLLHAPKRQLGLEGQRQRGHFGLRRNRGWREMR
jgi:hypothetical protein